MEPPEHKPRVVNVVVVGPFEEEEEGTSMTSEIGKVKSEDSETPSYLRGDRVRRDVDIFQSWVRPPWLTRDENPDCNDFPISV